MFHDNRSKKHPAHSLFGELVRNQRGSVLIGIIAVMVVVATLGTAMVTMTTSSTYTQIGSFDAVKAYYLAEAGGRYAIPIIRKEALAGGDPNDPDTGTIALLDGKTFTMGDSGKFRLALTYEAPYYILESTGLLRQGATVFAALQKVTFRIQASATPDVQITFDTAADLEDKLAEISGGAQIAGNKLKIDSGNDKAGGGGNNGSETELGLNWVNSETLPDLAANWTNNDGLLGYSLQIKANLNSGDSNGYVAGLSFRLNADTESSYGYSFVRLTDHADECSEKIPAVFCDTLDQNKLYVVLWKKIEGDYTIIDYHQATAGDGILTDKKNQLKDWSTLLVRIQERYQTDDEGNYLDEDGEITTVDEERVRENVITAYVQGEDDEDDKTYEYKRQETGCSCDTDNCSCTMHWQYDKFNQISWADAGTEPIIDDSLTSADFASYNPYEIGIHFLSDNTGSQRFFDDFAMAFENSTDGSGNSIVRY